MKNISYLAKIGACALLLVSLSSCEDLLEEYFPKNPGTPTFPSLGLDIPFYALSGGNKLDSYSTKDPANRLASVAITGLQANEKILAIDFRPATSQLYGIGSTNRIYVINQITGVAHAIGAGPFTPALEGNLVGFDFNPTADRIRLVTSTGQNLRLNPETGTGTIVDGPINGTAGATVTAVAYANNIAGVSTTDLYGIDSQNKKLYKVNPPNDGTLVAVSSIALSISGDGGFDIDPRNNTGLALFQADGKPTLFAVDVETGETKTLAKYDAGLSYTGIAIPTRPVAYAISSSVLRLPFYSNTFIIFDPTDPLTAFYRTISFGESNSVYALGLDFRPSNGQLYALGSSNRLYTINAATGGVTVVGSLSTRVENPNSRDAISPVGFDFNPVADRIRIVTTTGQNLRVNPDDATVVEDSRLNPGAPSISAAAYENNFAGATATNLFVIDSGTDKLYLQNPPNAGTVVEVGNLGVNVETVSGFDISGISNTGYAVLSSGNSSKLYTINKTTGAATVLNDSPSFNITGFTVGLGL